MGRKRRRSKKQKQKNSKVSGCITVFLIVGFLYLLGKFGWWALGFVVVIPIIKFFYERHTASVKGKSRESPGIPSSLRVSYQSQTSSTKTSSPRRRASSPPTAKEDVEKIAIQLAREFGGHLTPVELSLHTSLSLDESNEVLKKFVQKGHANLTNTEGGAFLYVFPGLLTVDKKHSPKQQPQKKLQSGNVPSSRDGAQPSQTLSFSLDELELLSDKISEPVDESSSPLIELEVPREKRSNEESLSELWVPPDTSISIHGYTISDGMVYVGHEGNEPAVIDPSLPVSRRTNRQVNEPLHYFPSYAKLEPEARTRYLSWLSSGRNDQHLDIGYVFLFFYGLERRVLVDIHSTPEFQHELPAIINEVKRLLSIYQVNHSFYSYATSFLTFILAKYQPEQLKVTKDALKDRKTFPFSLKYALTKFAVKGQPLLAPVAFTWFESSPYSTPRTPSKRCRKEFSKLFKIRYHAEFRKGLIINPRHASHNLSVDYKSANPSLGGQTYFYELEGFPDVSGLEKPIVALQKIVDGCIEDLEAYNRYLGRKANQTRPKVFALAQLPAELLDAVHYDEIATLRVFVENTIKAQTFAIVEISDLFTAMNLSLEQGVSRSESLLIAQLLGRLGYGIEPDVRFSGHPFKPQKKAVIFKLLDSRVHTASAEYTSASLLLTLSSLIVHADRTVSENEENHLREHIATMLSLTPAEHQRLNAHLTLLLAQPPSLRSVKKHLHSLTKDSKLTIAEFLIALSTTDGHVAPEEIDILKKLYTMFELDDETLYSAIHAKQTHQKIASEDSFQKGDSSSVGTLDKTNISLDMNRIAHTLQQTEQVQALLADVFEEASEESSLSHQATTTPEQQVQCLLSLDANHSGLFQQIANLERISLDDFTTLCKQFDVLPGGAIETLNATAFETVDEALIEEDGDFLFLDQDVAKEMRG